MNKIEKYNEYKKYAKWLKEITIYLFMNRKQLAEELATSEFEEGHIKKFRFGAQKDNLSDAIVDIDAIFEVTIME